MFSILVNVESGECLTLLFIRWKMQGSEQFSVIEFAQSFDVCIQNNSYSTPPHHHHPPHNKTEFKAQLFVLYRKGLL